MHNSVQWITAVVFVFLITLVSRSYAQEFQGDASNHPPVGALISTGDNYWIGEALPFDSPAAIEASFQFMKDLGISEVYWRGVQDLAYIDTILQRPESPRYYKYMEWVKQIHRDADPERRVVEAARKHGMKIWGLATLADWGATADTPAFADYPYNCESVLRLENPEWVPTDRYGVLKQGGNISLAYPEARKVLVDMHIKYMKTYGYDGLSFLTYNENHSMRFNDEFGYTEAAVNEFKEKYGIDVRTEDFARFGSAQDWRRLHGDHLTQYLRELKVELDKNNQLLGMCLNPFDVRAPQPWSTAPELMWTAGPMLMDVDTWVQEGLVDDLQIFGYCDRDLQLKSTRDMQWLTRGTGITLSVSTSQPHDPRWKGLRMAVVAFSEEESYFDQSPLPTQPLSSLKSDQPILVMKTLAQVIRGEKADTNDLIPLATHENLIVRRLALKALGRSKDPAAVATIENALNDEELTVRFAAGLALGENHNADSAAKLLAAVERTDVHPMVEVSRTSLPHWGPSVRPVLAQTIKTSKSPGARAAAMWGMTVLADDSDLPTLVAALDDEDVYVRYLAAMSLKNLGSAAAIEAMIAALRHSDPVVTNRTATSLAAVVRQDQPHANALRGKAIEGLKALYASLGDNTTRSDADWGYRPVGDALLVLGDEGRAVLQAFMDQKDDIRLAEQAWKNLYIARAWNSFSEVDPSQNAHAMRMRPQSLKTLEVKRMSADFEDGRTFTAGMEGMAGDASARVGRWGSFTKEMISTEAAHSGKNSLKLVRGQGSVSGYAVPGIKADNDYQLRAWVHRASADSSISIDFSSFHGTWIPQMTAYILPSGELKLFDAAAQTYVDTGLVVPQGKWVEVRLIADLQANTYSAALMSQDATITPAKVHVGFKPVTGSQYMVQFHTQLPNTNHTTFVDDVQFVETP